MSFLTKMINVEFLEAAQIQQVDAETQATFMVSEKTVEGR